LESLRDLLRNVEAASARRTAEQAAVLLAASALLSFGFESLAVQWLQARRGAALTFGAANAALATGELITFGRLAA
jgi:hypothetical protein